MLFRSQLLHQLAQTLTIAGPSIAPTANSPSPSRHCRNTPSAAAPVLLIELHGAKEEIDSFLDAGKEHDVSKSNKAKNLFI